MRMPRDPDHEPIFIPSEERGQLIAAFPLSVRLANVLEAANVRLSGDLHGRSFTQIAGVRNCGKKTIDELREIVRSLQIGGSEAPPPPALRRDPNVLQVSSGIREVLLSEVPLSVRLGNVLRAFGHVRLGDLHGVNTSDLAKVRNCGRKCIVELRELLQSAEAGEFTAKPVGDFAESLRVVARAIDYGLKKVGARNRKIFEQRLFGNDGEPRTLESVGDEFGMTRERVRQIVKLVLARIRLGGGPALARAIEALAKECEARVIPLTPELFLQLVGAESSCGEQTAHFYVRMLDYMAPALPAWAPGSTREGSDDPQVKAVDDEIEEWLRTTGAQPTAAEAIAHLRAQPTWKKLPTSLFFTALRRSRKVVVNFPEPDHPRLQLRRLRLFDIALLALADSPEPLTPEEIIERARARFGADAIALSGRTAENALTAYPGVFRLGPRAFGLRQHFASTERQWPQVRNRFAALLKKESRPISSVEVLDKQSVTLPSGVKALASIARTLGRAAPAYELEWELRAKFGDLFERVGLRQIEERLAQCPRFLRNTTGAFFLDADLDLEEFDLDALRAASVKALAESREILSCDDLLDRLELQGLEIEEMSAGMLASILRGGEGLQEVGHECFTAPLLSTHEIAYAA